MPFSISHPRALWRVAWLVVLALFLVDGVVSMAHAQELHLANLVLNNFEGTIRVRFGVEATGVDRIRQVLDAGDELALHCKAKLSIKRDYLWNRGIGSAHFDSRLRRLKNGDFVVDIPGQGPMVDKDLAALFRKAWGEILLDLGPWDRLKRGQSYSVALELTLARTDVSPWLSKGLFFWSFDAAPAVSYQLDFTY